MTFGECLIIIAEHISVELNNPGTIGVRHVCVCSFLVPGSKVSRLKEDGQQRIVKSSCLKCMMVDNMLAEMSITYVSSLRHDQFTIEVECNQKVS